MDVISVTPSANLTGSISVTGVEEGDWLILGASTFGPSGKIPISPTLNGSSITGTLSPNSGIASTAAENVGCAIWAIPADSGHTGTVTVAWGNNGASGAGGGAVALVRDAGATPSFDLSSMARGSSSPQSSGSISVVEEELVIGLQIDYGVAITMTGPTWDTVVGPPNAFSKFSVALTNTGTWAASATSSVGANGWCAMVVSFKTTTVLTEWPDLEFGTPSSSSGVDSYTVTTSINGSSQTVRVRQPVDPADGMPHRVLICLPAAAGLDDSSAGNCFDICSSLSVTEVYNATLIESSYAIDPCHANHATDSTLQLETYDVELIKWAISTFGSLDDQVAIIGYSKSALGAQALIFRNPTLISKAASWDFPAEIQDVAGTDPAASGGIWSSLATIMVTNYGTSSAGTTNFQTHYELSPTNLASWLTADPTFGTTERIWVGGFASFAADVTWYKSTALPTAGILADTSWNQGDSHQWHSSWMSDALEFLLGIPSANDLMMLGIGI
jgi:hypothetical protein